MLLDKYISENTVNISKIISTKIYKINKIEISENLYSLATTYFELHTLSKKNSYIL